MAKQELSTVTVEDLLDENELPENFEDLPARKQKEIIINTVLSVYKEALDCMSFEQKAKAAQKKLSNEIKNSPAAVKLAALKKDTRRNDAQIKQLLNRYDGMKQLAKALGISEKNFSQIKMIEG